MKFATKAVHKGIQADPTTGALMTPIYMTSTFLQEAPGQGTGYEYTRAGNPNFTILESLLATLENAAHATVFSSGLGALTALVTSVLSSGDLVLGINGLYGGTFRLFHQMFQRFGVRFVSVTPKTVGELENSVKELKPKWLLLETPTNPLLEIFDIAAFAEVAKKYKLFFVVDNTFATPYLQNPLDLGADLVWHSTTKYIGGHSDVIGGAMMSNHPEIKQKLDFARKSVGVNPSPFDTWLVTRGVKTLAVRMKQHEENGGKIADFLASHPKVKKVHYPGLSSHPHHAIAKKQMRGFGGMVSAEFNFSIEETKRFIASMELFALAESLGGVESLVCHPVTMTHASIPPDERKRMGISDGLVRFSVGIEDASDLIYDLAKALS